MTAGNVTIGAVIWLVDDSPLQRELTRRSLERLHDVVMFDLVGPMLERLASGERPDLLVLDWHMPEISGLEACRYVRALADGAELPIIVLTAQVLAGLVNETDIADAVKTFNLGFSEKPVRMSILSAMLSRAFAIS